MRKLLPWLLLAVLGVGVAVAAVVGQVQSPGVTSTDWLSALLSTTAAAGTAHLRISTVTRSANPLQRATTDAAGVIDFTTGDFRFVQVNHDISYTSTNGGAPHPVPYNWSETSIAIGQSLYEKDSVALSGNSTVIVPSMWNKFINPRNVHQAFGLDAGTIAENAVSGLSGIEPVTSVRSLGPATVNGVATTRYAVTYGSPLLCVPKSSLFSARGSDPGARTSIAKAFEPELKPTVVWIDGQGRLVQIRESSFTSAQMLKAVSSSFNAAQTNVTTLTFSDFGAPVHIVAPHFTGPPPRAFDVGGGGSSTCVH